MSQKKKSPGFPTFSKVEKNAAVGHISAALDAANADGGDGDHKKAIAAGLHEAAPTKHGIFAKRKKGKPGDGATPGDGKSNPFGGPSK
jgi:hypothetical protein